MASGFTSRAVDGVEEQELEELVFRHRGVAAGEEALAQALAVAPVVGPDLGDRARDRAGSGAQLEVVQAAHRLLGKARPARRRRRPSPPPAAERPEGRDLSVNGALARDQNSASRAGGRHRRAGADGGRARTLRSVAPAPQARSAPGTDSRARARPVRPGIVGGRAGTWRPSAAASLLPGLGIRRILAHGLGTGSAARGLGKSGVTSLLLNIFLQADPFVAPFVAPREGVPQAFRSAEIRTDGG